jgi:repressor LexA
MELTPRQLSVYEFILHHHQKYGMAPTVREICDSLGLKGPAGVHRILHVLIEKGFIETTPGKKRSWRPVVPLDPDRMIPMAGAIAAGEPIGIHDHIEEYLPMDPSFYGHDGCFAVRVTGDSMIERQIKDGDLAIIVPENDARHNTIVAVMVDNMIVEATLKIFRRRKNTIELHSANPAYPPLIFRGQDRYKVTIIGKYVGLIRKQA